MRLQFLGAARLTEREMDERAVGMPPTAQRERDVWFAVRRGAGEGVTRREVTRDLLHVSLWATVTLDGHRTAPYEPWTGVTTDERVVRGQWTAAGAMLARLREARNEMETAGGSR